MPGKGKGRSRVLDSDKFDFDDLNGDDELSNSLTVHGGTTTTAQRKRKQPIAAPVATTSGEMEGMLPLFGFDFTKTLQNKRKKLENFTNASLTSSDKKVKQMCQIQQAERSKLIDGYSKQVSTVITQWEEDMQKMKDGEEKVLSMMKQHHKLFQQQRLVQTQRFKTMKQLHEQFIQGLETLDKNHSQQTNNMQDELRKEMMQLKKKVLMESQQQEISTLRRSLQSMLAQVGEE